MVFLVCQYAYAEDTQGYQVEDTQGYQQACLQQSKGTGMDNAGGRDKFFEIRALHLSGVFQFCFNPKDAKTPSAQPFCHFFRSLPRSSATSTLRAMARAHQRD